MKLTKYHYHDNKMIIKMVIKDLFQMIRFIRWHIFIKIVLQIVKKFKKIVIMKKIEIIEKYCDN